MPEFEWLDYQKITLTNFSVTVVEGHSKDHKKTNFETKFLSDLALIKGLYLAAEHSQKNALQFVLEQCRSQQRQTVWKDMAYKMLSKIQNCWI